MRVAFLYNEASEDPAGLAEDGDPNRSPVVAALRQLGHEVFPLACTLDLAEVHRWLARLRPDVVFNRVESLGGSDALVVSLLVLLDTMQRPYTGCPSAAYLAATNKLTVKERLVRAGLPTPSWVGGKVKLPAAAGQPKYILKSVLEHASFAIDDSSIVNISDRGELIAHIEECEARFGRPYFAEEFIDGREFNLAVWGGDEPEVLPPAEIDFSAFPVGKPRIVGRTAKFDETSFEYENTPRRYAFPPDERPMIAKLRALAVAAWREFELAGYARIDFRCDSAGQPWILEINTNPCIGPESGFAAAMEAAGISYRQGISRILQEAIERHSPATRPASARITHEHVVTF